jgi:ribA/ribD-fused uncharacterized protein
MSQYTFFYSHRSPFSNWHMRPFVMDGVEFNCSEQAMMYRKALFFGDEACAKRIMAAAHPRDQKKLGREVNGFDGEKWDAVREDIVYEIVLAKFSHDADLKETLLNTKGTELVEASPYDRIWGIGLSETDERAKDKSQWQGLNLLGKVLDRARETLLEEKC